MRLFLAIVAVFLAFVVYIQANSCPNNDVKLECQSMQCASGYHVECVKGICTCNPNIAVNCISQQDCINNTALPDCSRKWHCVDNICKCGGNFG